MPALEVSDEFIKKYEAEREVIGDLLDEYKTSLEKEFKGEGPRAFGKNLKTLFGATKLGIKDRVGHKLAACEALQALCEGMKFGKDISLQLIELKDKMNKADSGRAETIYQKLKTISEVSVVALGGKFGAGIEDRFDEDSRIRY